MIVHDKRRKDAKNLVTALDGEKVMAITAA